MDSITLLSAAGKVAADAYFENKIHYSPASSYAEATARQVGCRGTRVSLLLWPSAREADSNKEGGQRTNSFLPDGGGGLHTSIAEWARQSCPLSTQVKYPVLLGIRVFPVVRPHARHSFSNGCVSVA